MTNTQFLSFVLKRTVLHTVGACLLGLAGYLLAAWASNKVGFIIVVLVWCLLATKEFLFDPKPDWRFWLKTVWDVLVWYVVSLSFYGYLLETYL